ncbi:hypothetical protein WJX77_002458 [Trebouxia sp. C0004]
MLTFMSGLVGTSAHSAIALPSKNAVIGSCRNRVRRASTLRLSAEMRENGNAKPNDHPAANGAPVSHDFTQLRPDVRRNTQYMTSAHGQSVQEWDKSLSAGDRGPVLLEDHFLIEKMQQFDREKVPERVVHARGMVAKGYFEVTDDASDITMAHFLGQKGRRTPVAARFSTVTHEKGSPEGLRDVRGFSVKMYTEQGNWDFVGNNIPVFFIKDGIMFPDLVHSLRPNPKTHIQEGWRILDFLGNYPESTLMLTYLLDYDGIPKDWRHMEGWSVNTFKLINSQGQERYVKFHFACDQGVETMSDPGAQAAGILNMRHSHATHDLVNAIAAGDFPSWTLEVQTMDPAEEGTLDFDPLDCTKNWPQDKFPLRKVGKMVINQNIDNFHNEAEQIAFNPGTVVPGITFSNDKVLQSRVFSYQDTQRYRIGNHYNMLPINAPRCPFHLNNEDGAQNWMHRDNEINYQPSVMAPAADPPSVKNNNVSQEKISGQRVRSGYPSDGHVDEYKQAGDRYRSFDGARKAHFELHVVEWMADPKGSDELRELWLGHWSKVDEGLGSRIRVELAGRQGLGSVVQKTKDFFTDQSSEEHSIAATKA